MIYEVDEALRSLLRTEALNGTDVDVVFEAPTKDWAARRNQPTVNLFLYDLREDLRRRQQGTVNEYGPDRRVVCRHAPPRHFKLSYLVTAWTQRAEDEHRLLAAMLYCCLRNETLRDEFFAVPPDSGYPVTMTVGLPPPEDRSFADVWTALGGELKPSLDVVVTVPIDGSRRLPAGPPVTEPLVVGLHGHGHSPETPGRHQPADAGSPADGS